MSKVSGILPMALLVSSSLCAMAMTGLVLRREFGDPEARRPAPTVVQDWEGIVRADPAAGPARAATLIVFTDYQCPFCRNFDAVVDSAKALFGDSLRVVMRHFPLESIHAFARSAAIAVECAGEQGRYDAYHRELFAQQAVIGVKPWAELAVESGVPDTLAFRGCMSGPAAAERVSRHIAIGDRIGLNATPTVLLNETQFGDPPTIDELVDRVRRLVDRH